MEFQLTGVFTALVTPFKDNKVDFFSLERLLKFQLDSGINGFVVFGTTAESPTLNVKEKDEIASFLKSHLSKKNKLIFGAGGNNTAAVSDELKHFEDKFNPDAFLSVVPYYNKPPQRGLLQHFRQIAGHSNTPIILYNVPSRTITSLELETIKELSEVDKIIGIKEASGNIDFAKKMREVCGNQFILLSGDDATYDEFQGAGGNGIISVASHIIPHAFLKTEARKNLELINSLYVESNPIPVKYALFRMRIIETPEMRVPLMQLDPKYHAAMENLLKKNGLLK